MQIVLIIILIIIFMYGGRDPKGSSTIKYVCMNYDVMYPKITSKTFRTGDTDHDGHNKNRA